jgi:hypothetical protein
MGSYTGEVLVRAYRGRWTMPADSAGPPTAAVDGVTAFPFTVAERILGGEAFKSFASFGRALPVVVGAFAESRRCRAAQRRHRAEAQAASAEITALPDAGG